MRLQAARSRPPRSPTWSTASSTSLSPPTTPCSPSACAERGAPEPLLFRSGQRVELVKDVPLEFLARLDVEIDVGFGANCGPYGPQHHAGKRPVAGDVRARSGLAVLHPEIVIRGAGA